MGVWEGMEQVTGLNEFQNKGAVCCCFCGLPSFIAFIILMCAITTLGATEQVVVSTNGGTGKDVHRGPQTMLISPFKTKEFRDATRLSPQQYAIVQNVREGMPRHEAGPMLLWLGAWDELRGVRSKIVLQAREYTRLIDSFTGLIQIQKGPKRIVPGIYESAPEGIQKAVHVKAIEYLVVLNKTSGRKRIVREEGYYIPTPYEIIEKTSLRKATILKQKEYAIIRDSFTGVYRHVKGCSVKAGAPSNERCDHISCQGGGRSQITCLSMDRPLFVENAYEEVVSVRNQIVLQKQDYVRLVDIFTGYARVVSGPQLLVPEPSEDGPGGVNHVTKRATIISSQVSVILFNKTSGKKYETRKEGLFVPGPYEEVMEVRNATVLKSQEYAVVKNDMTAKYIHYPGPVQLFVGAYEQLVKVLPKVILQKMDYVRLVDRRSGEENVVKGPKAIVPAPEQCEKDYTTNCVMVVKRAIIMKADVTVLILNRTSGIKTAVRANAGGIFTPQAYEDVVETRRATVLKQQDYAVIKNIINGSYRHAEGPYLLHLGAYEELVRVTLKVVLHNFEWIRLVNELTGVERVVKGPKTMVPNPNEVSMKNNKNSKIHNTNVQAAVLVSKESALLLINQATGIQSLITLEGMWIPAPYEHFVEKRPLIRVLANEAVIVRDYNGRLTVYDGTAGGAGTNFFLQARSQVVKMSWTAYGQPDAKGVATVSKKSIEKIDMRIQRTFYSYVVRTKDNVQLNLMGTIFWRMKNVTAMILGTSDPNGDVWHHSRSSFMQAVSNTSFDAFMGTFNKLANAAYLRDIEGNFYAERGVKLLSMEVTRFEAVDAETKATLRKINEETTNQITLLKKQEGENAVKAAKMRSDNILAEEQATAELVLETQKTGLIKTRNINTLLEKKAAAEGAAQPFAQHAKSFISALVETNVTVSDGLKLYSALQGAEHHNKDTANLAGGKATLFLTSKDVGLNFRSLNLGTNGSTNTGNNMFGGAGRRLHGALAGNSHDL